MVTISFLRQITPSLSSLKYFALLGALGTLHCSSKADTPLGVGGTAGVGAVPGGGGSSTGGGISPGTGGYLGNGGTPGGGTGNVPVGGTGNSSGTGATPGNGGVSGGGAGGSGAGGAGAGGSGAGGDDGGPLTAAGYMNLAVTPGTPFPDTGDMVTPAAPTGWNWYNVDGAICRDGSPTGLYIHKGSASKLVIYLEGGGACSNGPFCKFNPNSVNQVLAGDGQTVLGSAAGAGAGRQAPGAYTDFGHMGPPKGLFDTSNAANPFKDWNQVYIPYCTGDVFFGTKKDVIVPGDSTNTKQQFVGYTDMQKFMERIVPTFKSKVDQVILTGASAGGFGAALNYSMVQDSFGNTPVSVVDDSGPPFDDKYMPVCMQKKWRDAWGFDGAFPPDCMECKQADGAGLVHLSDFLLKKHPKAKIAIISSMQDEVIRLFYSVGLQNCMNFDTADPVAITLAQGDPMTYFPADPYTMGLNDLKAKYMSTGRLATYFMGGDNITYHQHIFRDRFYTAASGGKTIAAFVQDFINGTIQQIGP